MKGWPINVETKKWKYKKYMYKKQLKSINGCGVSEYDFCLVAMEVQMKVFFKRRFWNWNLCTSYIDLLVLYYYVSIVFLINNIYTNCSNNNGIVSCYRLRWSETRLPIKRPDSTISRPELWTDGMSSPTNSNNKVKSFHVYITAQSTMTFTSC